MCALASLSNFVASHCGCFVRAEGDGEQLVGGEEELCLSDSRPAETDRRADCTGEDITTRSAAHSQRVSLWRSSQGQSSSSSSHLFFSRCLQSEKDQAEMKELRETVEQQSKTIKRFNRGQ